MTQPVVDAEMLTLTNEVADVDCHVLNASSSEEAGSCVEDAMESLATHGQPSFTQGFLLFEQFAIRFLLA